jgi:acetyl esterase/lipase
MQYKKDLFSKLGYILVSVNYRLSPFPYEPDNPDRIKFPLHNQDVADALKWVYEHIDEYGGNPDQLFLLGHSAGAHLVALTGTNLSFIEQAGVPVSAIKGVAVIDTTAYDLYNIIQSGSAGSMFINAFGTDPQENIEASPQRNLDDNITYPPFFIAKRGDSSRLEIANAFIQSLRNHSVEVTDVEIQEYTHSGINAAIGKPGESLITPPLTAFMEVCFQED